MIVAAATFVGGTVPSKFRQFPFRRDGPILHGLTFFLLVLPFVWVWPRRWLAVVLGAGAYGGALEVVQSYLGRGTEMSDFVANLAGALLRAAIGYVLSSTIWLAAAARIRGVVGIASCLVVSSVPGVSYLCKEPRRGSCRCLQDRPTV